MHRQLELTSLTNYLLLQYMLLNQQFGNDSQITALDHQLLHTSSSMWFSPSCTTITTVLFSSSWFWNVLCEKLYGKLSFVWYFLSHHSVDSSKILLDCMDIFFPDIRIYEWYLELHPSIFIMFLFQGLMASVISKFLLQLIFWYWQCQLLKLFLRELNLIYYILVEFFLSFLLVAFCRACKKSFYKLR